MVQHLITYGLCKIHLCKEMIQREKLYKVHVGNICLGEGLLMICELLFLSDDISVLYMMFFFV